jgi:hypothetical protein
MRSFECMCAVGSPIDPRPGRRHEYMSRDSQDLFLVREI